MHSQCEEEISSQSSGSLVNLVNDDDRRRAGLASGNRGSFDSNFEVGCSQVSRQEKVILASRKVEQKNQTQAKSEDNLTSTRKLDASKPEMKNMEF